MPLLKKWIENGALFAIWRVEETAEELRKMLVASLPYDEELSQLKSEARQLEYLAVRVLLRAVCGEEKTYFSLFFRKAIFDRRKFSYYNLSYARICCCWAPYYIRSRS